jgi:hypothetical protein
MAKHPAAEILGYYRSHTRTGFGLEASDRELVSRILPGLSGLILLVKPTSALNRTGSYFFFQRGNLEMRRVGPEFPFAGSTPGGTPPPSVVEDEPPPPSPVKAPSPRPVQSSFELAPEAARPTAGRTAKRESWLDAEPEPEPEPAPDRERKRRKSLQWEIAAAGVMIAAALGLLWWQYRGDSAEEDAVTSRPAAARVVSLGLAVQPGEGGWRITWDPNTGAARGSVRGALNITESESHERIPLNADQIQAGVANYRPIGDDITFRLELTGPGNWLATETYRVLLKHPEIATAAPLPRSRPSAMSPAVPPPAAPPPAEPGAKTPETPAARSEGDSKEGYVEPEVVDRVSPAVPEGIRPRITSPQPIDVKVSIDREGHVTSATAVQHEEGLINYLGTRAVAAARQWTFKPATQHGRPISSSRTIHFVFEQ